MPSFTAVGTRDWIGYPGPDQVQWLQMRFEFRANALTEHRLHDSGDQARRANRKWILIMVTFAAAAVIWILLEQSGPRHPEFGRIYQTRFDEAPKGLAKITLGPITIALPRLFHRTADDMRLGSAAFSWSLASNTRAPKTGYVYFCPLTLASQGPPLNQEWEFALSRHTRLVDVKHQDLECVFYGRQHPEARQAFGDSWRTNSIDVAEGQVLYARTLSDPSTVHVLQLAKQGGNSTNGNILIEYVKVRTKKH